MTNKTITHTTSIILNRAEMEFAIREYCRRFETHIPANAKVSGRGVSGMNGCIVHWESPA